MRKKKEFFEKLFRTFEFCLSTVILGWWDDNCDDDDDDELFLWYG